MPTQNHTYRFTVSAASSAATYSLFPVPYSLNFTFSARERDTETGLRVTSLRSVSSLRLGKVRTSSLCTRSLRRFGSRYYSSDLSIWLSVDPQASKYPSLSPYVYCANNPIKLVDPNGEEIYEFDENGKYIGCKGPKGSADQLAIRKSDGTTVFSKEYENGTITKDFESAITQRSGNSVNVAFMKIKGDQNAKESFEFVADNTNVEWSKTAVGDKSTAVNYLSNSQERDREASSKIVLNINSTIREHIHSQPTSRDPSLADCISAENLEYKNNGNSVPTSIYHKGGYFPYNKYTFTIINNIKAGVKTLCK